MSEARVAVFGSLNYDFVILGSRLPVPGETVKGDRFTMQSGGKGANQALQAARLGARTYMIGAIGQDFMGDAQLAGLSAEGMVTDHIMRIPDQMTGTACIFVNTAGQNAIMIAPGANTACTRALLDEAQPAFDDCDVFLTQFETNMDAVYYAMEKARRAGCTIVLDPAPMEKVSDNIWSMADLVKPNETEAAFYTGIDIDEGNIVAWARKAAARLRQMGAPTVLITLGDKGAYYSGEEELFVPAFSIKAVDATAAGDSFAGALAVAIAEKLPIGEAIAFASAAGAVAASKAGAQPSIGHRSEVEALFRSR